VEMKLHLHIFGNHCQLCMAQECQCVRRALQTVPSLTQPEALALTDLYTILQIISNKLC
jgi:hypothetical protein